MRNFTIEIIVAIVLIVTSSFCAEPAKTDSITALPADTVQAAPAVNAAEPAPASNPVAPANTGGAPAEEAAIIEVIQASTEPGLKPEEKIVSWYVIFQSKKASNYSYVMQENEKKLVFEFSNTKCKQFSSLAEPPVQGFTIETIGSDTSKSGSVSAASSSLVRVTFTLDAVPVIVVNDEFNIISFSYKWTTNPKKESEYILKKSPNKIIIWSAAGVAGVGLGIGGYFILRTTHTAPGPEGLSTSDLPVHPQE
jgi:hypothetical protein